MRRKPAGGAVSFPRLPEGRARDDVVLTAGGRKRARPAVRSARYACGVATPSDGRAATPLRAEARAWLARKPDVPACWFRYDSCLHGVSHTQRVHVLAQRLIAKLGCIQADGELVLHAALWHDIGRHGDGVEPEHGASSVARADELSLTHCLTPTDAAVVRFAILRHSLPDREAPRLASRLATSPDEARRLAEPERALRVLWLLKDADALDRIRLGWGEGADPRQLRHGEAIALIPFTSALYTELA